MEFVFILHIILPLQDYETNAIIKQINKKNINRSNQFPSTTNTFLSTNTVYKFYATLKKYKMIIYLLDYSRMNFDLNYFTRTTYDTNNHIYLKYIL